MTDPERRGQLFDMRPLDRAVLSASLAVLLVGCEEVEQLQDRFRDLTPYEAYQESLATAGLDATALGRDWVAAGVDAVQNAAPVSLPFSEEGFITEESPGAVAYRVTIGRGQKLVAEVSLTGEDETRLFVDLFRVAAADDDPPRPVFSSDSLPNTIVHEPWRGGEYVLRVQPELLRGGQFRVELRIDAQLAFPVEGHGMGAVQSVFGVDREGGRRSHEGIDIFARRGTPVLAASAGRVNRVAVTGLGGKVVWVRDPVRGANVYYAHLDSQYVSDGQAVAAGDTLGFVGNSGNARTTPPHLHFGLYRRGEGAVDPAPFLRRPRGEAVALTADLDRLGSWVRLRGEGIRLRSAPDGPVLRELTEHTPMRVLGGSGEYYRVTLPDGAQGFVAARLTESLDAPLEAQRADVAATLLAGPDRSAPVVAMIDSGAEVPVLGRYAGFLFVEAPDGGRGWLADTAQQ